jgi:hypothetical protein
MHCRLFEEDVTRLVRVQTDEISETRNHNRIVLFPFPIGARSVVCVAEANAVEYWRALKGAIPPKFIPSERYLATAYGKTTATEQKNSCIPR